ncbi:MAG TPA: uL13 family ribosomal protein, partial [Candidatus Paceibacterota bacterium]
GYPGGLRTTKLKNLWEKNPAEALRLAVYGMLPKNKLRPKMIKRLKISL